jgi:ArsR family transcriptional regulator, arsenate/arsenite/antimonite-responsive transcriptional repressor
MPGSIVCSGHLPLLHVMARICAQVHMAGMSPLDALLSALSHPARRGALRVLAGGGEHCLCELMGRLGVSQSSMSRHMACLKDAGLVQDRRDAQWMRYRLQALDDAALQAAVDAVISADEAAVGRVRVVA